MIRIGEAASGEQEALIWGSLPGEGSFCRQLTREKRGPLIKVLFVLIFSFAPGEAHREGRDPAGGRGGGTMLPPPFPPLSGSEKERQRVEHQDGVAVGRGFAIRGWRGQRESADYRDDHLFSDLNQQLSLPQNWMSFQRVVQERLSDVPLQPSPFCSPTPLLVYDNLSMLQHVLPPITLIRFN